MTSSLYCFRYSHVTSQNLIVVQSMKQSEELHELAPSQLSTQDTGISTGLSSMTTINTGVRLRKKSSTYPLQLDDDDDGDDCYTDTFASDVSLCDDDSRSLRPSNLRRTRKGKFQNNMLTSCDDVQEENDDGSFDEIDDGVTVKSFSRRRSSQCSSISESLIDVSPPARHFTIPGSLPMYFAYLLCFVASSFSILYIILYGHSFGVERAKRWLLSMSVALLESFLIIEPMKVIFLAIYIAMFASQKTPEQDDNIVDEPLLQTDEACNGGGLHKPSKIRPPGGFALEQCKNQARKSARARKYLIRFGVHLLFFWSVVAFCVWDRGFMSYWSSRSVNTALYESAFERNGSHNITFKEIRSDADMWAWLNDVFEPHVMNKEASFYDSSNNFNRLLGKARMRQQRRRTADRCPAATSSSWRHLDPGFPCLSNIRDTASYYPGWSALFTGDNTTWFHSPAMLTGYGYWGSDHVYDDSGYVVHLDSASVRSQLDYLRDSSWVDRRTTVCFVEFAHYNPSTYWFTVSVLMFEFDSTGVINPSHVTQTVRLFSPSSAFYLDQLFIILIILIGMLLWSHEVVKLFVRGRTCSGLWKHFNFFNFLINVTTTCVCITFIYKEVYMEEVMRGYKFGRGSFTNFYGVAFICNFLTYISGFLLMLLIIKSLKLFRFSRSLCVFEKSISRVCCPLAVASAMFFGLVTSFAQLGYLVFGAHAIADFHDFHNSMYTMMRVIFRNFDPRPCFDALPLFTIVFFFCFYFGVFIIFCRLFAAVIIGGYKATRLSLKFPRYQVPECEIMEFMIERLKMKLGLIKPKQYRPNVHFEGMSEHSSESSFISLDSLGSCFTPERISQCSEASGISTSDSGLGSPSDHSLSLFDYLTLERPPSERPMDDLHLDYLFDRLSSYSVDMMLRKMDRVIKLGDDVQEIESELLEVTKRFEQKKVLKQKSEGIARAASSGCAFDSAQGSPQDVSLHSAGSPNHTARERPPVSVGGNIDLLLKKEQKINKPVRSSSYADGEKYLGRNKTSMREAENFESRKRPHSDEGARVPNKNSSFEGIIKKKTAW